MQWNEFSFRIRHFDSKSQQKVEKAFEMGTDAHKGQFRQSGEPYFTHPIAVANILIDMGADADTLSAALLHDTVEDTNVTLEHISIEFGPTVAALVDGVTKLNEEDIADFPSMNEQVETLRKMFTLMQKDVRIMVIKLADRLHNMQTIGFRQIEKRQRVAKETLDSYVKIADRLCMRDMRDSLEDLCRTVLEPESHAIISDLRKKNEQRGALKISYMLIKLKDYLASEIPFIDIHLESKTWEKMRLQYELEGTTPTGISGLNVAFICPTNDSCYRALGALHHLWHREVLSFEDFINSPVINGYKGIHTTILLEDGARIRCKIRTQEMDEYAHKGVTLFCFDSEAKGILEYLPWVNHISPLAEDTLRRSEKFWDSLQTDILGESIVVHGPSDQSALVPRGATALDAVFYLFGKDALRTEAIQINGKHAEFYDEMQNAGTVTATFGTKQLIDLSWLQHVRTGIASAAIRQELVKLPKQDKETTGRSMLKESFKRIAQIGMDELSPSVIRGQLHNLQVRSVSELYSEIAEGRLDPDDVARSIFRTKEDNSLRSEWVLRLHTSNKPDIRTERALRLFPFDKLSYSAEANNTHIKARYLLTTKQVYELQNAMSNVLKHEEWSLVQLSSQKRLNIAMIALVILWGLDPVFANRLLAGEVNAINLTIIRFITFFIASSAAYAVQHFVLKQKLKPLSPLHPRLLLSGIALFTTGLFTYITLSHIQATQYIVFVIAGLVLVNTIKSFRSGKSWQVLGLSFLLLVGGLMLMSYNQNTSLIGILSAIASSLAFSLYSEVSRRYQQEVTTIQARYPAFMFWVSTICLGLSLLSLPFIQFEWPATFSLIEAVVFALVFAVFPYALFFETSRRTTSKLLDNSLPFVFISTIVGELIVFRDTTSLISAPVLLIFLWLYLSGRQKKTRA